LLKSLTEIAVLDMGITLPQLTHEQTTMGATTPQ
jgi:hypothetical protein